MVKPTAALTKRSYSVKRGKRLRLTFTASHAGRYRLDVRRSGKRVKRLSGKARPGRNTVAFKVTLKPGRYTLRLAAPARAGDRARLRVN